MGALKKIAQRAVDLAWHKLHKKPSRKRNFDAGGMGRLLSSWNVQNLTLDQELYRSLKKMRARSRELCNNNDYAKRFVQMCKVNVVGAKGIKLQNKSTNNKGELDKADNALIEGSYKKAGKVGNFDVTGKLSRADGERLFIETVAKDGECLVRFVRGYNNAVGFSLQFIEADHLDEEFNVDRYEPTGNKIIMGVEVDGWKRPVAYHLLTNHPGDHSYSYLGKQYERVPAEDMMHLFLPQRASQTRGVPWMHASMIGLNDLGGYREAAIIASRIGASKMGFFTQDPDIGGEEYTGEGQDHDGSTIMEAEPGTFEQLAAGVGFETWDPKYPHEQFAQFNTATLRGIASGFGVAYHTLANDAGDANFGSQRGATIDERDGWELLQQWMIESFNERVYFEYLKYQLVSGRLPLPLHKLDKFNAATWQPRRWQWLDPLKDMQAKILGVDNRVQSLSSVIRDRGEDPDDVFQEIAEEKEKMKALKIEPATAGFLLDEDQEEEKDEQNKPSN